MKEMNIAEDVAVMMRNEEENYFFFARRFEIWNMKRRKAKRGK